MTAGDTPSPAQIEIHRRIARSGKLPFSVFMELALYHPGGGYYMRPEMSTGRTGDFSTSSDVSPAFGRRLAVQAAEIHKAVGGGDWSIVELGPGRGLLAGDLIEGLRRHAPDSLQCLEELVLVEVSPSLRAHQSLRLEGVGVAVRWVESLAELETGQLRGLVIGNEFLDALPVHWVTRRADGGLIERMVGLSEGQLVLTDGPVTESSVSALAERFQICPAVDDDGEVCLLLEDVLAQLRRILKAGAAIFVDYGASAQRLGDPEHADGTLVGYHRHRVELDLLARPGLQDLTAHVNWDHLEECARSAGFEIAGHCRQDRFLMALGITEDLAAPGGGGGESPAQTRERLAARSLIMPGSGGGRCFEVMAITRGIDSRLRGFGPLHPPSP